MAEGPSPSRSEAAGSDGANDANEDVDDIEAYVRDFMKKEKDKGNDTFTIDMSSSNGHNRGFRSPSSTVLRKDIPSAKEAPRAKAALPKFEKPAPRPKKERAPAPAPAPVPKLTEPPAPVRLPPVASITKLERAPAPEPEPEPEIETPRLYKTLQERFKEWRAENGEEGEICPHIRSKYDYEWDYEFGPLEGLNPMELGEGPIRKMQLEKRQKDFILCMALQETPLPCTIKQVRNQLQKEGGHSGVTEEDWMATAKQLYEDNRCNFGFTTAGVPFEVHF